MTTHLEKHLMPCGEKIFFILFSILLISFPTAGWAAGAVTIDSSWGRTPGAITMDATKTYAITSNLGQVRGSNLFHSLGIFNIGTGETAAFSYSGPGTISNVISRVTGGTVSSIDGTISSTIPGANFYLLNPAGILFGPNAWLDISGSFHVSTADYLRLGMDGFFYADTALGSDVLTSSAPSAFGFLKSSPAPISFNETWIIVPDGKTISVTGGNLKLDNTLLYASGGKVYFASAASAGEVNLNDTGINMTGFNNLGSITLTRTDGYSYDSGIYTSAAVMGNDGGAVYIRGGEFKLMGETINTSTAGPNPGGGINIKVTGDMVMDPAGIASGGALVSESYSTGRGGDVVIEAKKLSMTNSTNPMGAFIDTISAGAGQGGNINICVSDAMSISSSAVSGLISEANNAGNAGNITLNVGKLDLSGKKSVISTNTNAGGLAGTISVTAKDSVNLSSGDTDYGNITSNSIQASGNAGTINITAPNLTVDDSSIQASQQFMSEIGWGNTGVINLNLGTLNLLNNGRIATSNFGGGKAGTINITASDSIVMDGGVIYNQTLLGQNGDINLNTAHLTLKNWSEILNTSTLGAGGNIKITANDANVTDVLTTISTETPGLTAGNIDLDVGTLNISDRAAINASASGSGKAGNINITSNNLAVQSGAAIMVTSETGAGGNINITATDASVSGFATKYDGTKLFSAIQTGTFDGTSGTMQLNVGSLNISNGAKLDASSMGSGKAGDIIISAKNAFTVAGGNILSNTYFAGDGGNISITSPSLVLQDKGWIMAGSQRTANAGNIFLNVDALNVNSGSTITTGTQGSGHGGNISITGGAVSVTGDGSAISTGASGVGDGGSIFITANSLSLSDNGGVNAGNIGNGNSGNININVDALNLSNDSNINASTATFLPDSTLDPSGKGNAGNININASETVTITGHAGIVSSSLNTGNAGNVSITTPALTLRDRGYILTTTVESGKAGDISIIAGKVSLDNSSISTETYKNGLGGNISIQASSLNIDNLGTVDSGTYGSGKSGDIRIDIDTFSLTNGGFVGAFTKGTGPAGNIDISAKDSILITGKMDDVISRVTVQSYFEDSAGGNGGNLSISTPVLTASDGAAITASTLGDGNAGNVILKIGALNVSNNAGIYSKTYKGGLGGLIDITASGYVNINGGQINTSSEGSGNGGSIFMQMANLQMDNGGLISAKGLSTGTGGNITLRASDSINLMNSSFASTETLKSDGGNIDIQTPNLLYLFNSGITTSVQGGAGNGGNIAIDPQFVILNGSNIVANAYGGNGGNINIISDYLFASPDSKVSASSQLGISGAVNISAPDVDLSGSLAVLPSNYLDATQLMRDRCLSLFDERASSLVSTGRGGLPIEPDDYQPSP